MSPAILRRHYEKLGDFKNLAAEMDPQEKFRNAFLSTLLY